MKYTEMDELKGDFDILIKNNYIVIGQRDTLFKLLEKIDDELSLHGLEIEFIDHDDYFPFKIIKK